MNRGYADSLKEQVVSTHEDADLHEVERIEVVVVTPLETAKVDEAQVPGKGQNMAGAVAVRQTLT